MLYFENENRYSAQQSRLAIKASGDIDPAQHLTAYWENDWLGAGVTANSRESNSYNLRMRQAWLFYDNDNYHFNVLAGQSWSMLTANKLGILPGTENAPLTIDAQYAVGFNWARQPSLRFVQDIEQDVLVRRLGRGVANHLCLEWNASCGSVPQTALLCRPVWRLTLPTPATLADC